MTVNTCKSSDDICLILTQAWQPFGITTAKEGFRKLMRQSNKKRPNIKAVDANGNLHNFNEWVNEAVYFEQQPYFTTISKYYPVPTILVTGSSYFYTPRVRHVNLKVLYKHYKGCCQICGEYKDIKKMTKEHIKPRSKGGTNETCNITMTCSKCNSKKADIFPYLLKNGLELKPYVDSTSPLTINRKEWAMFIKQS